MAPTSQLGMKAPAEFVVQVAEQFSPLPSEAVVVCIGPRTAFDARAAGLAVHRIAEDRSSSSLVRALAEYAMDPDDAHPPVIS